MTGCVRACAQIPVYLHYTCLRNTHLTHTHTPNTHTHYTHTHSMDTHLLAFGVRGSSKHYSRTSQNYTSWKGNSRISFIVDASLHNKAHGVWQWKLMFKSQNKIFVFTCLLYSLCNKSHSVLTDAFLIQLVAPCPPPTILFLVLQEAPLATLVAKHLEREGWAIYLTSLWSHGANGNPPVLFLTSPGFGKWEGAQKRHKYVCSA